MSKLNDSIPRSLIKNGGVNICGCMEYWENTWHEEDGAEWAIAKAQIRCDQCDDLIEVGDLYSIGERMCFVDAPMPVHGIDRVHFYCTDSGKNVKDTAEEKGEDPDAALTKWKYEIIEQHPNINATEQAFTGIVAIITGEFPQSKEFYKGEVEKHGGFVKDNISPATTHMIVGAAGKTQYGQKTGPGSKKYAEGKKKKLIIVDRQWIEDGIANWTRTGFSVLNQAKATTETETETTTTTTTTTTTAPKAKTTTILESLNLIIEPKSDENDKKRKIEDDEADKEEEQSSKKQKCDDSEEYSKLTRKELQALAKENNIPANAKNEEIIRRLKEKK